MPISVYNPEEVDGITRFFRDDRQQNGEKIHFIQADYVRHVMIQKEISYDIYSHDQSVVNDVIENFSDATGLVIPEAFDKGTAVYNINGVLMDNGIVVPLRVLRQQIFLSGGVYPILRDATEHIMYHALGNALWNYLDYNVWKEDNERKNEYRRLRNIELGGPRAKYHKHQNSLFYIASEDFRYLFGTINAGRGQWFLDRHGISAPNAEVISNFWRREVESSAIKETSGTPVS